MRDEGDPGREELGSRWTPWALEAAGMGGVRKGCLMRWCHFSSAKLERGSGGASAWGPCPGSWVSGHVALKPSITEPPLSLLPPPWSFADASIPTIRNI